MPVYVALGVRVEHGVGVCEMEEGRYVEERAEGVEDVEGEVVERHNCLGWDEEAMVGDVSDEFRRRF